MGTCEYSRFNRGDFLSVYKKTVTDEDFLGSYYQLEYNIVPGMHTVASGKIILETLNQRIVVPVCCDVRKPEMWILLRERR